MMHVQLVGPPQLQGFGFTTSAGGSAIPETPAEKANFENLQKVINTYIAKFLPAASKISVDGKLGSRETLPARNAVMSHMGSRGLPALKQRATTSDLATYVVLDTLAIGAATVGRAVTPPAPDAPPPSPKTPVVLPPDVAQEVAKHGSKISPYVIMAGGGAVALLAIGIMWFRRRR